MGTASGIEPPHRRQLSTNTATTHPLSDEFATLDATAAAVDAWSVRTGRVIRPEDVEEFTWARAEEGCQYTATQVHAAVQRLVAGVCRVPEWWATGFDLLVTPTMTQPPLPIGEKDIDKLTTAFGFFTGPFSFTGQPAISLPLHWSCDGLPIGVQLIADYGREDLLFRVAWQLEEAQPWRDRWPPLHA